MSRSTLELMSIDFAGTLACAQRPSNLLQFAAGGTAGILKDRFFFFPCYDLLHSGTPESHSPEKLSGLPRDLLPSVLA